LAPLAGADLPLLESVTVGPLTGSPTPESEAQLRALRARFPRLERTACVMLPTAPVLEVLSSPSGVRVTPGPGAAVPLTPGLLAGQLATCALRVEAPEGHPAGLVAARFARSAGTWSVEDLFAQARPFRRQEFALRVDGHEVLHALLRPGDVIELCAGLLLRLGPVPGAAAGR
jgi:hypothetical protein